MNEIKPLTGLRFLAALYVCVMHLDMRLPMTYIPHRLHTLVQQGALGVTVFFVLSGFVLTLAHLKDFAHAQYPTAAYVRSFLFKRLARIYPAFFVGLLACMALSIRLNSLDWKHVLLNASFLQPWVPSTLGIWYGAGAWSVAAEMFFYLLFPFLLPHLLRSSVLVAWGVFVGSAVLGTAFGLLSDQPYGLNGSIAYNLPLTRLPEFVAGVAAGVLLLRHRVRVPAFLAGALALACAVQLSYAKEQGSVTLTNLWIVIPAVAAIIGAMLNGAPLFAWLGTRPWVYLGQVSYCFYIVQLPLLLTLDAWLLAGHLKQPSAVVAPVLLLLNLLGAVLLHELIEKPTHRRLMRWHRDRQQALPQPLGV